MALYSLVRSSRRLLDKIPYEIPGLDPPLQYLDGSCYDCGAEPHYEVLAHMLNCADPGTSHVVDLEGNFVWLGCGRCYREWRRELTELLHMLRHHDVACNGCGRGIHTVNDILLRVRKVG